MEQKTKTANQSSSFNRELDLGSMTLYDNNAITVDKNQNIIDILTERAVQNIKYIFEQAVQAKKQVVMLRDSLPQQEQIHDFDQSELYLQFPEPSVVFPRGRKIPEQKKQTKWQKFAKQKGIHKHKKQGTRYDPQLKKVVAGWGSKSKRNIIQAPIMEEKQNGVNPFESAKNVKKLKKQQQKLKQLKNKRNA